MNFKVNKYINTIKPRIEHYTNAVRLVSFSKFQILRASEIWICDFKSYSFLLKLICA